MATGCPRDFPNGNDLPGAPETAGHDGLPLLISPCDEKARAHRAHLLTMPLEWGTLLSTPSSVDG